MLALKAQLSYPHFRNRPLQIRNLNLGWEMEFGGIQMASNRKSLVFTIAGAVALAFSITAIGVTASFGNDVDVSGNNTLAAYVGTGGLLLPGSFSGSSSTKRSVADCDGCTWKYTIYCTQDSNTPCKHAVTSCPRGSLLYRVWFGRTPTTLATIGSVCWGSNKPLTKREVESRIDDQVIRYVPALQPGFDPPGGSLSSIPVIFWSGQPSKFKPPAFSVAGHKVSITATPTWHWKWGDGQSAWKKVPGAQYPSRQITHQYRTPATYNATVTTVWSAVYSVSGLGSFEASGEVLRQSQTLKVPIESARTVLIAH